MKENIRIYYDGMTEKVTEVYNGVHPYINDIFMYIILPALVVCVLYFLIIYKKQFLVWKDKHLANKGFIRIKVLQDNNHINTKMIKLDSYNNFTYKSKTYNLDKIQNYIIGYENNIPTILFYHKWIIPLMIRDINIEKTIVKDLGYTADDLKSLSESKITELKVKIKSIILKTDSTMLNLIYSKKLISDLYNVSMDNSMNPTLLKILIGGCGLALLWYTGYLDIILDKITNLI